jgi:hypothetical protein
MAEGNHMFLGQGAVPIFRGGTLIGAAALVAARPRRMRTAPAQRWKISSKVNDPSSAWRGDGRRELRITARRGRI